LGGAIDAGGKCSYRHEQTEAEERRMGLHRFMQPGSRHNAVEQFSWRSGRLETSHKGVYGYRKERINNK